MELRHIRYFVTLAEELHFGRAAERLNMAQPPLSRQIQQLEEELGTQLFERSHRRVRLSQAGEVFLTGAKRILGDTKLAVEETQRTGRGERGSLSIGFVVSVAYEIVPLAVREFRSRFPNVQIRLHEMTTMEQIDAMHRETIDLGFLRSPVEVSTLNQQVVRREEFVVALHVSHPLAVERRIDLGALKGEPFVLFQRQMDADHYDEIVRACAIHGFVPNVVQETTQMNTTINLVAAGLGASLVPRAVSCMERKGVVYRELSQPVIGFEISMVWRNEGASPLVRNFTRVVDELF